MPAPLECLVRQARPLSFLAVLVSIGCSDHAPDAKSDYSTTLEAIECNDCAVAVSAGDFHTCALLDDGRVKCWGHGFVGQLGLGDNTNRGDGPGEMGAALPTVPLGTGRSAVAVSASPNHTCALLDSAAIKCWGANNMGQLGVGPSNWLGDNPGEMGDALPAVDLGSGRTALAVATGAEFTCALLDDHRVKCWGENNVGQLGVGDSLNRGDGPGEMGDSLPAVPLGEGRTAIAISAGDSHACALLDSHKVKCWGDNFWGQLGRGDTNHRGDQPSELGDYLPAVPLGSGRTALAIAAGGGHTCALLDNHKVKCWGDNSWGQLGRGDTDWRGDQPGELGDNLPAVSLGSGRTANAVAAGGRATCAVLDNGRVKCWGANWTGELGLGDTITRGDDPGEMGNDLPVAPLGAGKTAIAISVGESNGAHTCALLNSNRVKCWGHNAAGGLGLGDTAHRGDEPGEMSDVLLRVDLD